MTDLMNWQTINEQAKILFDQKKFQEAIEILSRPDLPKELIPNLAKCFYYNKEAYVAKNLLEDYFVRSNELTHELSIDYALYLNSLGKHTEAANILKKLQTSIPYDPKVQFNLGWHYLRDGHFSEGFACLKEGAKCRAWGNEYQYIEQGVLDPKKLWDGETLIDTKVLLYILEGGLGDQIAFLRWFNHFRIVGGNERDVIACDPSLLRLLTNSGYNCIPHSEIKNQKYDLYIPAMSLPAIYSIENPKDYVKFPYIVSYEDKFIKKLIDRQNSTHKHKIGIKWFGNPEFEHDQFRTLPKEELINITEKHGKIYSLQFEENLNNIPNCKGLIRDWQDTYSVISALDIVVTSCTSIVHLCGSMNKKCIVMVPLVPYFIWANDELPWYESVTVIRQTKYNDWSEAFDNLDRKLKEILT